VKGQSSKWSAIEQVTATAVKFVWAMILWQMLAKYFLGVEMPLVENLYITGVFTVNSMLLGFLFRRLFNWINIKYHA